jgi:EpsI family protein
MAFYGAQRPGVSIHSPLHCLPGTGWEPLDVSTITVPTAAGPAHVRRMLIRKNHDSAIVLYWYAVHGRTLASELSSKMWLFHDALRMRRTDAALVRLVVGANDSPERAEARAVAFAARLLPFVPSLWS